MTVPAVVQKVNLRDLIKVEYQKCAISPEYFMKRYCYIQEPVKGRMLFDLYPYQVTSLGIFQSEDNTIVLKGRQIGLSTVVGCYALWMMLFHKDKNVLVIATKQETAKNLITKIRFAFDKLPVWLQVPVTENNKLSLRFGNGSQVKASTSSGDAGRSEAVSLLVLDEAAFIKNADDIWTASQATLATGGKAIIISTPNGIGNFFYRKYIEAEEYKGRDKDGAFFPIKLDWRMHPDRDEAWRQRQLSIISERDFRQEYEAEFLGSGNTVIDADLIEFYRQTYVQEPELTRGPGGDMWVWEQPNYTKSYIVVADVARGEVSDVGDYSTFHVIDVVAGTQVAEFKSRLSTTDFGHLLIGIATEYNDALLVIENSNVGWAVIQTVIDRGYKNLFYMSEDLKYLDPEDIHTNKLNRLDKKSIAGFTTSVRTRPLIISKLDQYMRDKSITIRSKRTIDELMTFVWLNGKAQAAEGHNDDLIMALCIGLWIRDTALQLHQKGMELTRLSLDKMHRTSNYDGVYVPMPAGGDPWILRANNTDFNMRELL